MVGLDGEHHHLGEGRDNRSKPALGAGRKLVVRLLEAFIHLRARPEDVRAVGEFERQQRDLVLLRHKFLDRDCFLIGAAQHGQRGSVLTRAAMRRRRMVAIEFGTWRSGRSGGSAGSVTAG